MLYRIGLRSAHAIVVQSETQRQMMQTNFGRASQVIPMPCPEPDPSKMLRPQDGPGSKRALWVGRLCAEKRPELLIETARQAPDLQFDIVGPAESVDLARWISAQAAQVGNVTYHGPVAPAAMAGWYFRAGCLVCTSHIEGLPNTFLEAWSQGLPVVSTWDPDDVITRRELGIACASSPATIANAIRTLVGSADRWARASANARAYHVATHRPELTFEAFEQVLLAGLRHAVGARDGAAPVEAGGRTS